MSLYLERCELCRDYRPLLIFQEGKVAIRLCLRCAYLTGRLKLRAKESSHKDAQEDKFSKIIDELIEEESRIS